MESNTLPRVVLVLMAGMMAACDQVSTPVGPTPASGSLVGSWTSGTELVTLGADGSATDLDVHGSVSAGNPEYRFSGTWSANGGILTLSLPRTDSSLDGLNWFRVSGSEDQGYTEPYSLGGDSLTIGSGTDRTTYLRTTSGGGSTPDGSVAAPIFLDAPGTYTGPVEVRIDCATPYAAIYYTTDGTFPTTQSWRYLGPIQVSSTTTLRAIAMLADQSSRVVTAVYNIQPDLPSTTLVGTWIGIFAKSGSSRWDTVTTTYYGSGNFYSVDHFSERDPATGEVTYGDPSSAGTWTATALSLTTVLDGQTQVVDYSVAGNTLTIDDPSSPVWPSTQVYRRE